MIRTLRNKIAIYKRKRYVHKTAKCCGEGLKIHGSVVITPQTELGTNVSFNGMTVIGHGRCVIGNNFHCAEDCYIITENHDYDNGDSLPYGYTSIQKPVIIEDNVWLGVGVKVLPGAHIGEGVIAQAGSLLMGDIPPLSIVGGIPAKTFKMRDKDHYYKIKKEGKFI